MATLDCLAQLPAELALRIIDWLPLPAISKLTQCSKYWHNFINNVHQDVIYANKADRPDSCHDLASLKDHQQSFVKYTDGASSWKNLCKMQTTLSRNWVSDSPEVHETLIQVSRAPIWRFRPDFQQRYILSTSQTGGMYVTDMDSGRLLWSLPEGRVRAFAHLEYSGSCAVWDREGNALEIWKALPTERGHFEHVAILPHECETRGFHLAYPTLCVVSTQGKAFVYDLSDRMPRLQTSLTIEEDAVGHIVQNESLVVYSMGVSGYHFYNKSSGAPLGVLDTKAVTAFFHIKHPRRDNPDAHDFIVEDASTPPFPMRPSTHERLERLTLERGFLKSGDGLEQRRAVDLDEWGAGLLQDNVFVGISRGGRTLICADYQEALKSPQAASQVTSIIECETDGTHFDFGGWLSIKHNRILFAVNDKIYILMLDGSGLPHASIDKVWAIPLSSSPNLNVPVSFMEIYDDCLMATYAMIARRTVPVNLPQAMANAAQEPPYATKAIHVVSFAPQLEEATSTV